MKMRWQQKQTMINTLHNILADINNDNHYYNHYWMLVSQEIHKSLSLLLFKVLMIDVFLSFVFPQLLSYCSIISSLIADSKHVCISYTIIKTIEIHSFCYIIKLHLINGFRFNINIINHHVLYWVFMINFHYLHKMTLCMLLFKEILFWSWKLFFTR